MSAEFEAGVEESLELTQRWLKEEECGSLSISQSGGLLALVCLRSGTNLGAYLKRSIEPPGSDDAKAGGEGRSFRCRCGQMEKRSSGTFLIQRLQKIRWG